MSTTGLLQEALHDMWESDSPYTGTVPGPAQEVGLTKAQWDLLIEPIIDTVWAFVK